MRTKKDIKKELDKALAKIRSAVLDFKDKDERGSLLFVAMTGGIEARVAVDFQSADKPKAYCAFAGCPESPIIQIQPTVSLSLDDGDGPSGYSLRLCRAHRELVTEEKLSAGFNQLAYSERLGVIDG